MQKMESWKMQEWHEAGQGVCGRSEPSGGKQCLLTEHIEGESETCQAEAFKETQGAEHGDVDREGNSQTKHQHE